MKFDVVIGNPPYQEESAGTSRRDEPIYHLFYDSSFNIDPSEFKSQIDEQLYAIKYVLNN